VQSAHSISKPLQENCQDVFGSTTKALFQRPPYGQHTTTGNLQTCTEVWHTMQAYLTAQRLEEELYISL
jgi:hypothetical protein